MSVLRQQEFKRPLIYLFFVPMPHFKMTGGDLEFERWKASARVWGLVCWAWNAVFQQPKLMAQIISGIIGIMQFLLVNEQVSQPRCMLFGIGTAERDSLTLADWTAVINRQLQHRMPCDVSRGMATCRWTKEPSSCLAPRQSLPQ